VVQEPCAASAGGSAVDAPRCGTSVGGDRARGVDHERVCACGTAAGGVIAAIESALRDAWRQEGRVVPRTLHVLKLGRSEPYASGPFVLALFGDKSARPLAIAKVARIRGGQEVQREWKGVELAQALLPRELRAQVPQPLALGTVNGLDFGLWGAVPGVKELHQTFPLGRVRRASSRIKAALEWNGLMVSATVNGAVSAATWLGSWDDLARELSAAACEPGLIESVRARLEPIWEQTWPAALAHNDFFAGNLLFSRSRVTGVVDWGAASARAPVFVDRLGYELSFSLQAIPAGDENVVRTAHQVHTLPAFTAARAALHREGVDASWGGEARLVAALAGLVREVRSNRAGMVDSWKRWLRFELAWTDSS
jgi:Phosphotransferase enzyme family